MEGQDICILFSFFIFIFLSSKLTLTSPVGFVKKKRKKKKERAKPPNGKLDMESQDICIYIPFSFIYFFSYQQTTQSGEQRHFEADRGTLSGHPSVSLSSYKILLLKSIVRGAAGYFFTVIVLLFDCDFFFFIRDASCFYFYLFFSTPSVFYLFISSSGDNGTDGVHLSCFLLFVGACVCVSDRGILNRAGNK